MLRPPQHRVDAPIVFVHSSDPAWDMDRIAAEQAAMLERNEDPLQHPVARYQGGWTRYDLDAVGTVAGETVTVREYLDESKQPTMWYLRRLPNEAWYEVLPLWEKAMRLGERPFGAYLRAVPAGLVKVENGPTLTMPGGRVSAADFGKIRELGDAQEQPIDLPFDLGCAIYQASMPLTESEGKH